MTILKITIEDEQAELLRKLLKDVPYIKKVEEEHNESDAESQDHSPSKKIKDLLESAKGRGLFNDIKDPVEWQRELRKEWERDF